MILDMIYQKWQNRICLIGKTKNFNSRKYNLISTSLKTEKGILDHEGRRVIKGGIAQIAPIKIQLMLGNVKYAGYQNE